MNNLKFSLEARAGVEVLAPGFAGPVETECQAIRVRNQGPDPITLTVGGQPFEVAAGRSWGFDTGRDTITIRQTIQARVPDTVGQLVLVERIYLTPWKPN